MPVSRRDQARLDLLGLLQARGYSFVTPAPSSHRRILLRRWGAEARTLEDVFGWNLPFRAQSALGELAPMLEAAAALRRRGQWLYADLRVAKVGRLLLIHSPFPAKATDAVFMGPDSYAFIEFIRREMPPLPAGASIADVGTGTGAGGLFAAGLVEEARLTLADINPASLEMAAVNAAFAGTACALVGRPGVPSAAGPFDLVVANPPYLGAGRKKVYSDGGDGLGGDTSLAWTHQALGALAPGGRFLLYTGSPIRRGHDALRDGLQAQAVLSGCAMRYAELNPDIFPSTLLHRPYWGVERIAAVGAVFDRGT
jgi:hypothetical protein